jgi:hypothetical protein
LTFRPLKGGTVTFSATNRQSTSVPVRQGRRLLAARRRPRPDHPGAAAGGLTGGRGRQGRRPRIVGLEDKALDLELSPVSEVLTGVVAQEEVDLFAGLARGGDAGVGDVSRLALPVETSREPSR